LSGKSVEAEMKARRAHWWDPRTWLAFMFWELRMICAALYGDGMSDWTATVFIAIFEFLAIVGLTDAAAVYLGRRLIDNSSPFGFLVGFAVLLVNTPALVGKHRRWDSLCRVFSGYPTPARIAGGVAVVLIVIGAIFCAGHFGEAQRHLPR
jgi:hypothetical protein